MRKRKDIALRLWHNKSCYFHRMKPKTKINVVGKKVFHSHHLTVHYWALLTIFIFPIALLSAANFGYGNGASFLIGAAASFAVLAMNALMERRLWIFSHPWRTCFESPDFSFKLAMISGVILLIMETAVLVLFFIDKSLDVPALQIILSRNCQNPPSVMRDVCSFAYTQDMLKR